MQKMQMTELNRVSTKTQENIVTIRLFVTIVSALKIVYFTVSDNVTAIICRHVYWFMLMFCFTVLNTLLLIIIMLI